MSDYPVPSLGGSYIRNDETGELTRVEDLPPAVEPVEPEAPPAITPTAEEN